MQQAVIAVAIVVVLAAFLVLATLRASHPPEYYGGAFSNAIKTPIRQLINTGANLSADSKLALAQLYKEKNPAQAAANLRRIEGIDAIRNGNNGAAKTALEQLEASIAKNLDEFAAKPLANLPAGLDGANGKTFAQLIEGADLDLAGKVAAHYARTGDMSSYYKFQTFALNSGKELDSYVFTAAGAVKVDKTMRVGLSILLTSKNRKEIRAALKTQYGITDAHHLEDVLRSAEFPDASISSAVKNLPPARSFWQRVTGKYPNEAEKAYKDALGEARKSKWYTDWKTGVAVGFAVLAGLIIPISQWLWPKPGSGPGGSTPACDGLCQLLNDPTSAAAVGASSWLSISCCCCCCCLLIISMMGGGKKANNNFF